MAQGGVQPHPVHDNPFFQRPFSRRFKDACAGGVSVQHIGAQPYQAPGRGNREHARGHGLTVLAAVRIDGSMLCNCGNDGWT